jgi:arylsulfatase A-like enzyme
VILLSFPSVVSAGASNKPNILILLADDLGYADVGFQECKDIPTPNVDALARSGIRFSNGYVNHPFCSPTRAALMTGRYPQRFGHENNPAYLPNDEKVGLPTSEVSLPQLLRGAGYVTGGVGKWHLGAAAPFIPNRRGFDEWFGFIGGGHIYLPGARGSGEYNVPLMRNDEPNELREYLTPVLGREASAFIRRHRNAQADSLRHKPWFLYLAFNAPHTPLQAPPELLDKFAHVADKNRRTYAAMVHAMDAAIGDVLTTLRETGQEENTLVFFLSDNGGPLVQTIGPFTDNAPLRGHKGQVYEGGIRVPFVVCYPERLKGGRTYDEPVAAFDIFSTALAVAGATPPNDRKIDGVNVMPYLIGERKDAPHDFLFWRAGGPNGVRAARTGNYKLVRLASGKEELYNLKDDIAESNDVAAAQPELLTKMRAALDDWDKQLIAPIFTNPQPTRRQQR